MTMAKILNTNSKKLSLNLYLQLIYFALCELIYLFPRKQFTYCTRVSVLKTKYTLNWPDTYPDRQRTLSYFTGLSTPSPRVPSGPGGNTNRCLCFFLIIIFCLVAFVRINRVRPVLHTYVSCRMRPSTHHSNTARAHDTSTNLFACVQYSLIPPVYYFDRTCSSVTNF